MKKFSKIFLCLAIFLSVFNGVSVKAESTKIPFTDVSVEKWYYDYVKKAYELELMTGKTETAFDPYANMTRGQVAVVLYRMAGQPEVILENLMMFQMESTIPRQ